MTKMTHVCEHCRRIDNDLTYSRRLDQYLCEPCLIHIAEQFLYNDSRRQDDEGEYPQQ